LSLFCVQLVQLRREVTVRFVDIGKIDDHHNLIKIRSLIAPGTLCAT